MKFYIKPQQYMESVAAELCCILLKFYIKPQPLSSEVFSTISCILLKFYIKPQLDAIDGIKKHKVVSY